MDTWRRKFLQLWVKSKSPRLAIALIFIQLLAFPQWSLSQTKNGVYISFESSDLNKYQSLIASLDSKLSSQHYSAQQPSEVQKGSLIVSIGYDNFVRLLESKIDNPILAVSISSASYYEAVSRFGPMNTSAIFLESSPEKQLRLIRLLSGQRKSEVLFLYSAKTTFLIPLIEVAAQKVGNIEVQFVEINSNEQVYSVINSNNAKWLLAYPDKNIYNQTTLRNVLLSLYKKNQALIGFSQSLITSGAVGSAVSSTDDILMQTVEGVNQFAKTGRLPLPEFIKYSSYVLNIPVARSLNIKTDAVTSGR